MSSENNNLLTFLKKNSLFQSPTKSGPRKSKSRSKDKSDSRNTPIRAKQTFFEDNNYKSKQYPQPVELNFNTQIDSNRNYAPIQNNFSNNGNNSIPESRFVNYQEPERSYESFGVNDPKQNNEIWAGLVSYTTSFQSARIESTHCLQNLSSKVRNQIANINVKIENFNSRMYKIITDEFKNLRERVMFIIDESFKESQKYIRQYMKTQQEKLAGDLNRMRQNLHKQYLKIQAMKEEIAKPNWRKVAGEIISSSLESHIDEMVKYSSQLAIGRWQLGDLVGYRLKDLERDLRDVVRLKRDP